MRCETLHRCSEKQKQFSNGEHKIVERQGLDHTRWMNWEFIFSSVGNQESHLKRKNAENLSFMKDYISRNMEEAA